MFDIVEARQLARNIKLFVIRAPRIAKKQRPGQFIILRLDESGERIPLTIADADPKAGTITICVQAIGKTTMLMNLLETGDAILDVVGPLGKPSEIEKFGTTVVVSGSVGTAMAYPTARELKRAGNKVISIVGARSKDLLVLEDEVREVSDETYILTDDGTWGEQGLVTERLKKVLESGKVDYVLAVGPVPMMRAVANLTAPLGDQDHRQPEFHHGGRHRDVRRLPRAGQQQQSIRLRGRPGVRRFAGQLRGPDAAQQHVPRAGALQHRAVAGRP